MSILIIGSGGREYSFAEKIKSFKVYMLPTNRNCLENVRVVNLDIHNFQGISDFIKNENIEYCIIGPEYPLSLGIVDYLKKHNAILKVIGPGIKESVLETNKIECRKIVNSIDQSFNPKYTVIENFNHISELCSSGALREPFVFKPRGLTSGKGVKIYNEFNENVKKELLSFFDFPYLIEEKLIGQEFSLTLFSKILEDGRREIIFLEPVQDFKRVELNSNVNTGGMGAISGYLTFLTNKVLKRCQKFMGEIIEKYFYEGFLYGNFIVDDSGKVKLIEFNVRPGDPEAINILSGIDEIDNNLVFKRLKKEPSITRYITEKEYPLKSECPYEINIDPSLKHNMIRGNMFKENGKYFSGGGRILAFNFRGPIDEILPAMDEVCELFLSRNKWAKCRMDIGYKTVKSGVDVDKNEEVVKKIRDSVVSTFNSQVVNDFGDFGGIIRVSDDISLISSIDGVGTKTKFLISTCDKETAFRKMAVDLISHSVNDIIVKGAKPIFFLDYIASANIDKESVFFFVDELSINCKKYNIVLMGGETAEMPDIYTPESVDVAGAIIGSVDKNHYIDGKKNIKEGDVIIGIPSNGVHTNGYSMIRRMIDEYGGAGNFSPRFLEFLKNTHRCYFNEYSLLRDNQIPIHGMCHITGGGLTYNLPRVLPDGLKADMPKFKIRKEFVTLGKLCGLSINEIIKTFNCGFGMIIFVSPEDQEKIISLIQDSVVLGSVKSL